MTRKKQVQREAARFTADIEDWEMSEDLQDAFMQGAQWADANPDIDVRMMAAWRGGYKEAIERACEWLEKEMKGNCRFCADCRKQELESLVKHLKEK